MLANMNKTTRAQESLAKITTCGSPGQSYTIEVQCVQLLRQVPPKRSTSIHSMFAMNHALHICRKDNYMIILSTLSSRCGTRQGRKKLIESGKVGVGVLRVTLLTEWHVPESLAKNHKNDRKFRAAHTRYTIKTAAFTCRRKVTRVYVLNRNNAHTAHFREAN